MKKGRGSHVPTSSAPPSRAAGVKGARAIASLDAGEDDGTRHDLRMFARRVEPASPPRAHSDLKKLLV